jgi:hypothetical protein
MRAAWALPAALACWGWIAAGEADGVKGLGVAAGVALLFWPLVVAFVTFGAGPLALACVTTADMRAAHRHRRGGARPHIPVLLQRAILAVGRHRCLYCRETRDLQLDHIFPFSRGGLTCLWNMVPLCAYHNRVKSDYWRYKRRGGRSRGYYRPWEGADDEGLAGAILDVELAWRRNPLRWLAASWRLALALA